MTKTLTKAELKSRFGNTITIESVGKKIQITTYTNQWVVTVNRRVAKNNFTNIPNSSAIKAMSNLSGNEFKLWFYFMKNTNKYAFALSQVDVGKTTGVGKTSYHDCMKKLIEKGYLIKTGKGNFYNFYEVPKAMNNQNDVDTISENSIVIQTVEPLKNMENQTIETITETNIHNKQIIINKDTEPLPYRELFTYFEYKDNEKVSNAFTKLEEKIVDLAKSTNSPYIPTRNDIGTWFKNILSEEDFKYKATESFNGMKMFDTINKNKFTEDELKRKIKMWEKINKREKSLPAEEKETQKPEPLIDGGLSYYKDRVIDKYTHLSQLGIDVSAIDITYVENIEISQELASNEMRRNNRELCIKLLDKLENCT